MALNIIFMGTPEFAVPTLKALLSSKHRVVAVYSQPPRPAGRGQKEKPSPVHALAEAHHIPVFTPTSLKGEEEQALFKRHHADVAVVAAYGLLLPKAILEGCRLGCINIHPSDLPRWRGAAPLQRTIMAGDTTTACCIMQMDEGLDTGAVLLREEYHIPADMDAGGLHDHMASHGAMLVMEVLHQLEEGSTEPTPQQNAGATYAAKISKEEARIDWTDSAIHIHNKIRGLSPNMGAFFYYKGEAIKVWKAALAKEEHQAPAGAVLDGALTVACGTGALQLLELQRPGKKPMRSDELLRGYEIPAGSVLE